MLEYQNITIHWLGHDSFWIHAKSANIHIYIDPYELSGESSSQSLPKANIIITTHEHGDHCNPDSINLISTADTYILGPNCTHEILKSKITAKKEILSLNPNEQQKIGEITISAIPAYNTHRFRSAGNPFHPKESGHIGPIIHIGDTTIYHAGDTDKIPEMENLQPTIALLPVSGTYVMDAAECAEAVKIIKPQITIPMHVGRGIGKLEARDELKAILPDFRVEVLDMET
ncbi:MAG: MBL fold metallo-hydrolase [Promethearchaeota archaeon]